MRVGAPGSAPTDRGPPCRTGVPGAKHWVGPAGAALRDALASPHMCSESLTQDTKNIRPRDSRILFSRADLGRHPVARV